MANTSRTTLRNRRVSGPTTVVTGLDIATIQFRCGYVSTNFCELTPKMVWGFAWLINYISTFATLRPGDLIWTGTPKGISHIYPGDRMRLEIDGIGALENAVMAE